MRVRVRKHLETIVVAGVVGALAAGAPAVAGPLVSFAKRAGNADKVDGIDASRTPRAGVLLALNANAKYPRSVVPAGARGRVGARGLAGPAGLQGGAGPAGARGETGAVGPRGATGPQGLQGLHGTDGATGPQGDRGETGTAGADGTPGALGPKGDKGATGDAGAEGAPGTKGDRGDTGTAGADGAPGAPGAKGDKGDTGSAGANGSSGALGPKGDKGDEGETGPAGANGAAGGPGAKGEKGDAGPAGAKGDQGDKGEKGDVGPAGSAAAYPPIVDINPILRPSGSHLWDRVTLNGSSWFNGYRSSFPSGTSESFVEWNVPLQAGTWTIDVVYVESSDAGVMTVSLGANDLAPTIDGFRPQVDGIGFNRVATFSGVSVASTGIHSVRIRTASKNDLSSGYFGYLTWIRFVRE